MTLSIKSGGMDLSIKIGSQEEEQIDRWTKDLFKRKHSWMSEMEAQRAADVANGYLKLTGDVVMAERMALKRVRHSGANVVDKGFRL